MLEKLATNRSGLEPGTLGVPSQASPRVAADTGWKWLPFPCLYITSHHDVFMARRRFTLYGYVWLGLYNDPHFISLAVDEGKINHFMKS